MRKNFNVPLLDVYGQQAIDDGGKPVKVGDVAVTALTAALPDDAAMSATEKVSLVMLAFRIVDHMRADPPVDAEFSKAELVTIKARAEKTCRLLPFARLVAVLDADEAKGPESE